ARRRVGRDVDPRRAGGRAGARGAGPARALPVCQEPVAGDRLSGDQRGRSGGAAPADAVTPAIVVEGPRRSYGDRDAPAGVSFDVRRGELFALLGPNGGGKSTLFRILATLLPPTAGRAHILGHDVQAEPEAVRRHIGVVFQHPSVDGKLTVEENL